MQRECQRQAADFAGLLRGMPSGREDDAEPPRTGLSLYPAFAVGTGIPTGVGPATTSFTGPMIQSSTPTAGA